MTDMEKGNIYDLGGFGLGEFEGIDTQGEEQTYKFATPTGPRYLKPEVFRELNRVQTRGVGPFHKMTTPATSYNMHVRRWRLWNEYNMRKTRLHYSFIDWVNEIGL